MSIQLRRIYQPSDGDAPTTHGTLDTQLAPDYRASSPVFEGITDALHGKSWAPLTKDGLEVFFVTQLVRITTCVTDDPEDMGHVVGNRPIDGPHMRQIKSAALVRVPPGQQKIGNDPALTCVTLGDFDQTVQSVSLRLCDHLRQPFSTSAISDINTISDIIYFYTRPGLLAR
jgi:hypothetical protein